MGTRTPVGQSWTQGLSRAGKDGVTHLPNPPGSGITPTVAQDEAQDSSGARSRENSVATPSVDYLEVEREVVGHRG